MLFRIYRCPKCQGLLFYWEFIELGKKQCPYCGDGKVGEYMEDLLAEYNAPFNDYKTPFHRFSAVNVKTDQEIVEHFVTHAYEYNLMFRFGSITTDHPDGQRPPHTNSRFKVIVSNNAVHFNLSGIDAPAGRSSEFAQVFTLMYEFIIVIVKVPFCYEYILTGLILAKNHNTDKICLNLFHHMKEKMLWMFKFVAELNK